MDRALAQAKGRLLLAMARPAQDARDAVRREPLRMVLAAAALGMFAATAPRNKAFWRAVLAWMP
jgi:hypothetical protein